MKIKQAISKIKLPCLGCPYALEQVHTLANPCPQCKEDGYKMFGQFKKKLLEDDQGRA